jgi:hypothetical protein
MQRGALVLGLLAAVVTDAVAGHGGHGGARAPRVSAPRGGYRPPRMPHSPAPARGGVTHSKTHTNTAIALPSSTHSRNNAASSTAKSGAGNSLLIGRGNSRTASAGLAAGAYPNTYTYGQGLGARSYRAYGYGAGYRNRYYGRRYGYGRSQGNNRAIISRLRSAQGNLARIDHDYQGHRVAAMHAIAMAIRQLSHRSMIYSGAGFSTGMGSRRAMGMGMGRGGMGRGGMGAGRTGRMTQAQSDARMSYSLRTLQGINMQLGNQASFTTGHARARGHVTRAIHELSTALSIR